MGSGSSTNNKDKAYKDKAVKIADEIFAETDTNKDKKLSVDELVAAVGRRELHLKSWTLHARAPPRRETW